MIDGYWIHTLNRAIMLAGIITRHLKRLIISYKGKLIPALILSTHSNDAFQDSYSHYTQHCSWVRRAKQFGLLGTVHEGGPLFRGAHLTLPRREWANCCALFLAPAVHQKSSNKKKIYPFFTPINKINIRACVWSPWAAWDCSIPRLHFVGVPKLIALQPRTYTMSRLIPAETKHLSSHADLVITRLLPTPRSRRSRNHGIHTRCSAWSAFCLAKTCPARRIHSRWISMISPI